METSKQEKSEESRSSSDSEKPANVSSRMWEVICLLLLSQHPASMPGIDNTQVYQMLKKIYCIVAVVEIPIAEGKTTEHIQEVKRKKNESTEATERSQKRRRYTNIFK